MSYPNKSLLALAVGALLTVLPVAHAHAGVVVAVSGPSAKTYPVGRKIGANDRIVLQTGDTLSRQDLLDVRFVPLLPGQAREL